MSKVKALEEMLDDLTKHGYWGVDMERPNYHAKQIQAEVDGRFIELPAPPKPGQNAMGYIRDELDKRGIEWRKWSKGNVETCWFSSGADIIDGNFFVKTSVSKDRRQGPVHYKGYITDPRFAIIASLEHPPTVYNPRTLEDVLRDVWKEALDYAKSDIWRNPDEVFAERAAEIRELLGVDA